VPSRFLYLVRHGEAGDEGFLTEAGRQQATATGEHLRGVQFRAIRHSPLARAEQTAELIASFQPGVPMGPSGLLGDYPPPADGPPGLPGAYASFLAGFTAHSPLPPGRGYIVMTPFCPPSGTSGRGSLIFATILIVTLSPVSRQSIIPNGPFAQ
jgi:hypothetical protein